MKEKNNRKGFTLVELLATIAVLAIVVGLVAYVAINAINEAREKTYKATIKNVESNASNYLAENAARLFFLSMSGEDSGNEYQCITVRNLMDMGFLDQSVLKSKVNKNDTVQENNYIYVERDAKTRAIIKNVYDTEGKYSNLCGSAMTAQGDIKFEYDPKFGEYSREKEVTITYKLKNINNVQTLDNYHFRHAYNGEYTDGEASGFIEKLTVTSNGTLNAWINDGDIAHKTEEITTIDREGPVAIHKYTGVDTVKQTVKIPINIHDNKKAGLNKSSVTKNDFKVTIGGSEVTDFTLGKIGDTGNVNLTVNNKTLAGEVVIVIKENSIEDILGNKNKEIILKPKVKFDNTYTVTLNPNGGTVNPTSILVTYDKAYTGLPTPTRTGYIFDGWYTAKTDGTEIKSSTIMNRTEDHTLYAHWTVKTVQVTFDCNGGTGGGTKTYTYGKSNQAFPNPALCTRTGYTGSKWLKDKNNADAGKWNWTSSVSDNWINSNSPSIKLYAQWTANKYTVKFDCNGGNKPSGKLSDMPATYGQKFTMPSDLCTRSGYTQTTNAEWKDPTNVVWKKAWSGNWTYVNGQYGITNGTLTLKAQWTTNTYTVTYNVGSCPTTSGGSTASNTATYGADFLTTPNGFTCTGYTFNGWKDNKNVNWGLTSAGVYENGNGTHPWTWTYTEGRTLTAQWKANTYTITLNPNGGTVAPTSISVTYDKTYTGLPTPTRIGYIFDGWYTAKTDGTKITTSTKVTITSNQTLYAHWTAKTVQVTFDCNGGTGGGTKTYTYGKSNQAFPNPALCTRTGYTGSKWLKDKNNADAGSWSWTSSVSNNWINSNSPSIKLYAQWIANKYTVKFDCNGGNKPSGKLSDMTATYGQKFTMPSDLCTRSGYTQTTNAEWKDPTNVVWKKAWSGNWTYVNGQYGITNGTLTLKAQWTANKYTVKFDCNGGSKPSGKLSDMTATYGQKFTMPSDLCTRSGYTQTTNAEWKDSTNVVWKKAWSGNWTYVNGQYGITNGTLTLKAQWTANPTPTPTTKPPGGGPVGGECTGSNGTCTLNGNSYTISCGGSYNGWTECSNGKQKHKCTGYCYNPCTNNRTHADWITSETRDCTPTPTKTTTKNSCTRGFADKGSCNSNARADCGSAGYTGCSAAAADGCYSYACKTPTKTSAPSSGGTAKTPTKKSTPKANTPTPRPANPTPRPGGGGGCFLSGTSVVTYNGYKDIDKLQIGDMVLTYNENTKQNEYNKVTNVYEFDYKKINEILYTLTFDDKTTLKVSSTHNFHILRNKKHMWIAAKDIKKGDYVRYSDGTNHKIIKIKHRNLKQNVYNITVENTHNFYVGEQEILVHNIIVNEFGVVSKNLF